MFLLSLFRSSSSSSSSSIHRVAAASPDAGAMDTINLPRLIEALKATRELKTNLQGTHPHTLVPMQQGTHAHTLASMQAVTSPAVVGHPPRDSPTRPAAAAPTPLHPSQPRLPHPPAFGDLRCCPPPGLQQLRRGLQSGAAGAELLLQQLLALSPQLAELTAIWDVQSTVKDEAITCELLLLLGDVLRVGGGRSGGGQQQGLLEAAGWSGAAAAGQGQAQAGPTVARTASLEAAQQHLFGHILSRRLKVHGAGGQGAGGQGGRGTGGQEGSGVQGGHGQGSGRGSGGGAGGRGAGKGGRRTIV